MVLSNSQIERYSRQIIVPRIGGIGQERLLAARVLLVGTIARLESALAYLTGAGVGTIFVRAAQDNSAAWMPVIERMRELNSEVNVAIARAIPDNLTLIMAVVGTDAVLEDMRELCTVRWNAPVVFARLDRPAKIALLPSRPPCPACADAELLMPPAHSGSTAPFVAMVAAVEALKILVQYTPGAKPMLIELDRYESRTRELRTRSAGAGCACPDATPKAFA